MKILAALVLFLFGCGLSSRGNELVGQVKNVMLNTPLICPSFYDADVSMGLIRNGSGSMSKEDVWLYVPPYSAGKIIQELKEFMKSGQPVRIVYNVQRVTFCREDKEVVSVEALP